MRSENVILKEKKESEKKKFFMNTYLWIGIGIFLLIITVLLFFAVDNSLTVREYRLYTDKVQSEVRLVMISDLHRSWYGEGQNRLIETVKEQRPDAILFCGDIFDEFEDSYDAAEPLLAALSRDYPCYYVSGNHEYGAEMPTWQIKKFRKLLSDLGIEVLESENRKVFLNGSEMVIGGIADENQYTMYRSEGLCLPGSFYIDHQKISEEVDRNLFSLLLCHRPIADLASKSNYDLVLSGHAHGGQWRIPGILNGVYAPNQGIFPGYAGGEYHFDNGTTMIVGRGLCTTVWIPRLFNPPEVISVIIQPPESVT